MAYLPSDQALRTRLGCTSEQGLLEQDCSLQDTDSMSTKEGHTPSAWAATSSDAGRCWDPARKAQGRQRGES